MKEVQVQFPAVGKPGAYQPYEHQRQAHALRLTTRFLVLVWHRRAGKTVFAVLELLLAALACQRQAGHFGYIGPLRTQAEATAWSYLTHFARAIPGTVIHKHDLSVTLPNGARVRLFGADNPDSFRGLYFDGVVIDEVADIKANLFGEIIRPALMDRQGWALFIGTPKGTNLFSELYFDAMKGEDSAWKADLKRWRDTNVIPPEEVEQARREMTESQWAQEMECDFAAAVDDVLIKLDVVLEAQRRRIKAADYYHSPVVMGIDPARYGNDRTAIRIRQGLMAFPAVILTKASVPQVASTVARIWDEKKPDAAFIDDGGVGGGVTDMLINMGYPVVPVQFGGAPTDPRFADKRAEMWWELEKWLHTGCIPDSTDLATDLTGPRFTYKDAKGRFRLESKDKMRERGMKSPDEGDSLALTFFAPVAPKGMRRAKQQAVTAYDWRTGQPK